MKNMNSWSNFKRDNTKEEDLNDEIDVISNPALIYSQIDVNNLFLIIKKLPLTTRRLYNVL